MDTLEGLVEEYQQLAGAMTEKEKAVLESRVWALRPPSVETGGREKGAWLQNLLGAQPVQMADRSRLLSKRVRA
jgi:hypothetical protein